MYEVENGVVSEDNENTQESKSYRDLFWVFYGIAVGVISQVCAVSLFLQLLKYSLPRISYEILCVITSMLSLFLFRALARHVVQVDTKTANKSTLVTPLLEENSDKEEECEDSTDRWDRFFLIGAFTGQFVCFEVADYIFTCPQCAIAHSIVYLLGVVALGFLLQPFLLCRRNQK